MKKRIICLQRVLCITLVLLIGLLNACSRTEAGGGQSSETAATSSLHVEEDMEIEMDEDESYTIR